MTAMQLGAEETMNIAITKVKIDSQTRIVVNGVSGYREEDLETITGVDIFESIAIVDTKTPDFNVCAITWGKPVCDKFGGIRSSGIRFSIRLDALEVETLNSIDAINTVALSDKTLHALKQSVKNMIWMEKK